MNKRIFSLVLAAAMAFGACAFAEGEEKSEEQLLVGAEYEEAVEEEAAKIDIKLTVGEKLMTVDGDTAVELDVAPTIINERTMVPLRAIFEALGAAVSWDDETKTVFAATNKVVVVMQIGQDVLYVNGEKIGLDSPAVIVDNRTLVPARAVAEAFGNTVGYDEETKTVTITN